MGDIVDLVLGAPLRIAGILLATIVARQFVKRLIDRVVKRTLVHSLKVGAGPTDAEAKARSAVRGQTLAEVLKALASAVIWVLAALLVLGEFGINLAPLIAGLGIVGVALGFGAQSLVSDLVSGIFLLAEDQFGVGDIVDIDGTMGTVESVGLRTTQVRALDGLLWTIRNGEITRLANANKGWGRVLLDVGVAYGADVRRAAEIIRRTAEQAREEPELAGLFLADPEMWGVSDLGADAVAIRLVVKSAPASQWQLGRELRLRIKEALDREGIEIPFPQRTMWLRTEPAQLAAPIPFEQVAGGGNGGDPAGGAAETDKENGAPAKPADGSAKSPKG